MTSVRFWCCCRAISNSSMSAGMWSSSQACLQLATWARYCKSNRPIRYSYSTNRCHIGMNETPNFSSFYQKLKSYTCTWTCLIYIYIFFFEKRKMKQQKRNKKIPLTVEGSLKIPKSFFLKFKSMNEINFSTSAWVSLWRINSFPGNQPLMNLKIWTIKHPFFIGKRWFKDTNLKHFHDLIRLFQNLTLTV